MNNILRSYIPKFLVDLNRANEDVITVSTNYFSTEGDVYTLEKRTISPVLLQTTQSINELRPEISIVYPFSDITPLEYDGATLLRSPSITTQPTASQMYYVPIYFERFTPDVVEQVDKTFYELRNVVTDAVDGEGEPVVAPTTALPEDVAATIEQLQELIKQLQSV